MPSDQAVPPPARRVSSWWRALAILLALLLFVGGATGISLFEQFKAQVRHLQGQLVEQMPYQLVEQPQIRQLAVLLDEQQQPAMLVTIVPRSRLILLQRLNEVREGREQGLQLWALDGDRAPRSLGVIERKLQTPQLALDPAVLDGATELAISVEGKDGAPEGRGPNLPWLFRGHLVDKAI